MTRIFLDNSCGITLIDGSKVDSGCYIQQNSFSIQHFPFDSTLQPIFCAVDNFCCDNNQVLVIKFNNDYILKFFPAKKAQKMPAYLAKSIVLDNITHNISCHADDKHMITIETENEIFHLYPDDKVLDFSAKSSKISNGQLILINAKLQNHIYFAIIHYSDDYHLLLSLTCDELNFCNDGIVVIDKLNDTLQRKCVRVLKFCEDSFVEESRHFEYLNQHDYPDEIIPYAFLESLNCHDDDMARYYLAPNICDKDYYSYIGDFIEICDCVPYTPFHTTLIYAKENGYFCKTFKFSISNGKIQSVKCL